MKQLLRVLLCLCVVWAVCAQTRPKLSEVFQSQFRVTQRVQEDGHWVLKHGEGTWDVDQPNGRSIRQLKFSDTSAINIQRYDQNKSYIIDFDKGHTTCTPSEVSGQMPDEWSWVQDANYTGKEKIDGKYYSIWEHKANGPGHFRLGVEVNNSNTPGYLGYFGNQFQQEMFVDKWITTAPSSSVFDVPTVCNKQHSKALLHKVFNTTSPSACISSKDIMTRAQVWVDNKVPYNQGGLYMGYREDCSGYVSYCWESDKPGHTTFTMHEIAHQITKAQLVPGDCLLWAAEHVVLFGGWTDSTQTHYWAYEETKPGTGTVKSKCPYPYFYSQSSFVPFRYSNMCS